MAIIEICGVSIEFPGVKALNNVSFEIEKGQVVALCGENGAGKSTLGKIIAGVNPYGSYEGEIYFEGSELKLSSTLDAEKKGISIVHQELNLFNEMTVAENIFLSSMPHKAGIIDFAELNEQARRLLEQINLPIDPQTKVKDLTLSRRQMVEIAKAISKKPKVLIFDEATSSLTHHEVSTLYDIIRALKKQGTTMLYVSHKLNEIFDICDTVVVLKDGTFVKSACLKGVTKDDVIRWTVGRELKDLYPAKRATDNRKEELLQIQNWNVFDPKLPGKKVINNLSLSVKKGEILGIYGLVGSGRTELVESIFEGLKGKSSGTMNLNGQQVKIKSPAHAIENGIALITEDRKRTGLVLGLSVEKNITLPSLRKISNLFRVIDEQKESVNVHKMLRDLRIKVPNPKHLVKNLSGGNQQKVVLAKWLLTNPVLLLLDEPTRGIDVGAKAEIYKIMRELAEKGISIIMVSSELPEIIGVSDRILVMKDGRITGEVSRDDADEETLARYAMGDVSHVS